MVPAPRARIERSPIRRRRKVGNYIERWLLGAPPRCAPSTCPPLGVRPVGVGIVQVPSMPKAKSGGTTWAEVSGRRSVVAQGGGVAASAVPQNFQNFSKLSEFSEFSEFFRIFAKSLKFQNFRKIQKFSLALRNFFQNCERGRSQYRALLSPYNILLSAPFFPYNILLSALPPSNNILLSALLSLNNILPSLLSSNDISLT